MAKRPRTTNIFVGDETMYAHPHSLLPPNFFERVIAVKKKKAKDVLIEPTPIRRTVLTIESWDGKRQLMAVQLPD